MQDLTTIAEPSLPSPLPLKVRNWIAIARNKIERRGSSKPSLLPATVAPDEAQRKFLQARVAMLAGVLRPATAEQINQALAKLKASLSMRRNSEDEAAMSLAIYREALAGLPALALQAVVSEYVAGRLGDGEWMPSPPRLRRSADHYAGQWKTEKAFIEELLAAEIVQPVESSQADRKRQADEVRRQFGIAAE